MNILVIKTGGLGDVVRTSFMAQALKDKYKNKELKIFWLTSKGAIPLFVNNIYVDGVFSEENKNKLKQINFDMVINLEEDEENAKFSSSLNPKRLIGVFLNKEKGIDYSSESKEWFDMSIISKLGKKRADFLKKNNKKTHRELMSEIIGIKEYKRYEPFLRLNEKQRRIASDFLRRHNLSRTDLIIGINTGCGERWPKELSIEKTVKLIDELSRDYGGKILLFGGPSEIERNKEIVRKTRSHVIDTGSGNNLIEFPAIVSVCNLFITSDTLGLHVALALKRKTIVLIGPTSPTEIDMYGFGDKVVAKSKDVGTYKIKTDCMEKINLNRIFKIVDRFMKQKISIIITAFKEPKTIGRALDSALEQKTKYDYNIIVSAPDKETLDVVKEYQKKSRKVNIFKDPGKGKMFALNLIFDKIKSDILIFTDGDVYISENSVEEIAKLFLDPEIGCVSGRPVPVENKKTKFGYWANFLFESAHLLRKNAFENNKFLECSGYLFACRNKRIRKIPLDTAEDAIIPYDFWERGYKIGYAEKAEVYVRNVDNFKDWVKQKVRTTKAHETLGKYVDTKTTPRVKTFGTEMSGFFNLFGYAKNGREFYWSSLLAFSRLYMWALVFYNTKVKKFESVDNWERIESTK